MPDGDAKSLSDYINDSKLPSLLMACKSCLRTCWAPGPWCPRCQAERGIIKLVKADNKGQKGLFDDS